MTCSKCNGCLEWEYNGLDHNLKCLNCSQRYYDVLPTDPIEKLLAEIQPQALRRAVA